MNAPKCNTCLHFIQHYVRAGRSYRKSYYGHCVYPRLKRRKLTPLHVNIINPVKRMMIIKKINKLRFTQISASSTYSAYLSSTMSFIY